MDNRKIPPLEPWLKLFWTARYVVGELTGLGFPADNFDEYQMPINELRAACDAVAALGEMHPPAAAPWPLSACWAEICERAAEIGEG